jgi:hypothetical protein
MVMLRAAPLDEEEEEAPELHIDKMRLRVIEIGRDYQRWWRRQRIGCV